MSNQGLKPSMINKEKLIILTSGKTPKTGYLIAGRSKSGLNQAAKRGSQN